MFGLSTGLSILLLLSLLAACAFTFINGFHDTANAVATVIYTHSLKPNVAVIWSAIWNFIGVSVGGIAVAMGIVNLLPVEALIDSKITHCICLIMSLIITAIIWNVSTWYFGIPCSSSHTLIGSIFGVGMAYMILPGGESVALNWSKVEDVGLSLLISPFIGFFLAMLLMMLLKLVIKNKKIFKEPPDKKPPPIWIRIIMIFSSTGVSYAHGSNDGQIGVGLIMIILIGIAPISFALDRGKQPPILYENIIQLENEVVNINPFLLYPNAKADIVILKEKLSDLKDKLNGVNDFKQLSKENSSGIRKDILLISKKAESLFSSVTSAGNQAISKTEILSIRSTIKKINSYTEYSTWWVILMVSISLGLGTMIGWKRIVVTVGEKIGKTKLNYAQGFSSQIIAATTISCTSLLGLPVSTTHVLSSGVAGTMVADGGLKNLRINTIKNIAIAWTITLPVTIVLSGSLFLLLRLIFG